MSRNNKLILIAFVMVLMGAVLPFLMVIGVWQTSYLLSFTAYAVSIGGLFLGIIGAAQIVKERDWYE